MEMPVGAPIVITLPRWGVLAAESVHSAGFSMRRRKHKYHEIYFLQNGQARYYEEDGETPIFLSGGDFLPICSGVRHRVEDRLRVTLLILALSDSFLKESAERRRAWKSLLERTHSPIRPDLRARNEMEASFRRMLLEQSANRPGGDLLCRAQADEILVTLSRAPDAPAPDDAVSRVAALDRALCETFFKPWGIEEAARLARLSRRRFSSLFREVTGQSFIERRNRLRLDHAAELLREGNQTIAGAAFSSGFGDLAHFYRLFKRRYGMPPAGWMKTGAAPTRRERRM